MDSLIDLSAMHAAEEYLLERYTDIHRDTIEKEWGYEPEELAKIEYNADGYLACGITRSRLVSRGRDFYGEEEWIIEVTPDIGPPIDPERYRVYRATVGDEEWIVEQA